MRYTPRSAAHPLVSEFFTLLSSSGRSLHNVATQAGYDQQTGFHWIKDGYKPSLTAFSDHLNALGFELVIRPKVVAEMMEG